MIVLNVAGLVGTADFLLAQSRNHRFCVIAPSVAERSVARGDRSCYVIDTSLHNLVFYVIVNSARLILITLIFAVPTIFLIDGPIVQGLVVAVLSVGTTIAAVSLRQGEAGFLLPVIRPIVGLAMIPAVWMLFQIVPLDNTGLAHPIWQSAEQALGSRIGGSISVNPGATLVALGQYLSMFAVTLLAAAVAVDRQRAEWVLFALVAAAALVAVVMIGHGVMHFTFLDEDRGSTGRAQARDCVALGLIASTAAAIRTFERRETAHLHPERSATTLLQTFAVCLAVMLCGIALALDSQRHPIVRRYLRSRYAPGRCGNPAHAARNLGRHGNRSDGVARSDRYNRRSVGSPSYRFYACIRASAAGSADLDHPTYFGRCALDGNRRWHLRVAPANLYRRGRHRG